MRKQMENMSSYLRTENAQIDVCLNCDKEVCKYGTCERVNPPQNYVVVRRWQSAKGISKESFLRNASCNYALFTTDRCLAIKRTKEGAINLMREAQKKIIKGKLEVIKVEESEIMDQEKYQTN